MRVNHHFRAISGPKLCAIWGVEECENIKFKRLLWLRAEKRWLNHGAESLEMSKYNNFDIDLKTRAEL